MSGAKSIIEGALECEVCDVVEGWYDRWMGLGLFGATCELAVLAVSAATLRGIRNLVTLLLLRFDAVGVSVFLRYAAVTSMSSSIVSGGALRPTSASVEALPAH
jgi:hypothetical protein